MMNDMEPLSGKTMKRPNSYDLLQARNAQLMAYQFMTPEQQKRAEKEYAKVKKEVGL
jgi:hypothetical protein